jgi:hypothetical protein
MEFDLSGVHVFSIARFDRRGPLSFVVLEHTSRGLVQACSRPQETSGDGSQVWVRQEVSVYVVRRVRGLI